MSFYSISNNRIRGYAKKNFGGILSERLDTFWKIFNSVDQYRKVELLKEFSIIKLNYGFSSKSFRWEMRQKGALKNRIKDNNRCKVCNKFGTIVHHIIQIQNGGQNIKKNLIAICPSCHSKIHPWVVNNETARLSKEMDEEFIAICK